MVSISFPLCILYPPLFPSSHLTLQVCVWSRNWWHLIHRWWWCGCLRPGCSQIVTSLCCATWRKWAVGWSTVPRPYLTVSTSSGPSRSWQAMGCLFPTPTRTVNWLFFIFVMVAVVVVVLSCFSVLFHNYDQQVGQWMCHATILVIYLHPPTSGKQVEAFRPISLEVVSFLLMFTTNTTGHSQSLCKLNCNILQSFSY